MGRIKRPQRGRCLLCGGEVPEQVPTFKRPNRGQMRKYCSKHCQQVFLMRKHRGQFFVRVKVSWNVAVLALDLAKARGFDKMGLDKACSEFLTAYLIDDPSISREAAGTL